MNQPTRNSGKSGAPDVSDKIKRDAKAAKSKAAEVKSDAVDKAKAKAKATADDGTGVVADEVDTIADAARSAARTLRDDQNALMSDAVAGWADGLAAFASDLRERSVDELIRDARKIAHKSPAGFLLGTVAVGFIAARFAKATAPRDHSQQDDVGSDARIYDPARYPGAPDRDPGFEPSPRAGATPPASPASATESGAPRAKDGSAEASTATRRGEHL